MWSRQHLTNCVPHEIKSFGLQGTPKLLDVVMNCSNSSNIEMRTFDVASSEFPMLDVAITHVR